MSNYLLIEVLNPFDYSIVRNLNLPLVETFDEGLSLVRKLENCSQFRDLDRVVVTFRSLYNHVLYFAIVLKFNSNYVPFNSLKNII